MAMLLKRSGSGAIAALTSVLLASTATPAAAQKATACTKLEICYCFNTAAQAQIDKNLAFFRDLIATQKKTGKAVGYMSIPLSSAGGGVYHINAEVAASVRTAVEARLGAEQVYLLNPAMPEADIPNGSGADYMLMWTQVMEGPDGLGDFDFVYFVGPQDFARYFALDGKGDLARLEQIFDTRAKTDPLLQKAIEKGLTRGQFRNYYGLKASTAISRGAHDEWNILRAINAKRLANDKLGIPNQIMPMFDGRSVSPADHEQATSVGYVGTCAP